MTEISTSAGLRLSDAETSDLIATVLRRMADDPAECRRIVVEVVGDADHPAIEELVAGLRERLLAKVGTVVRQVPGSKIRIADAPRPGDEGLTIFRGTITQRRAADHTPSPISDAAWFAAHPHREFRCRHLTEAERALEDAAPAGSGLTRLIYVRRSDGATAKVWTPQPGLLLAEEDEARARFCAQGMPNPPPLDGPVEHVEAVEAPPEVAARVMAALAVARPPQSAS